MKKFYFLFLFLYFGFCFSQNSEIRLTGGAVVSTPFYYCGSPILNLEVSDYSSNLATSFQTLPISDFNSIINNATDERDVEFNAAEIATDKFSYPIDLDFSFKFFNTTYTKVVVGSNGRLVFTNDPVLEDLNNTATFIDRTFSGNRQSVPQEAGVPLPSSHYNRIYKTGDLTREIKMAQIFAAFTRLKITSGRYRYKKFDTGTHKGILITFQNVLPTDGLGGDLGATYTSRVILFDDGRVVLNVKDKTAGRYNAILGMQNEDGNKEIIPGYSSYNNGNWSSASSDAYVITTSSVRTPTYLWELDRNNDGTIDETSNTRLFPNFIPTSDIEKLSVKITFLETSEIRTSSVEFKKLITPIITTTSSTCAQVNLETDLIANVTYEWRKVGDPAVLSTTNKLSVTASGDYVVRIIRTGSAGLCMLDSAPISLSLNGNFPPFDNSPKFICKSDGSSNATVNLYDYYPLNPTQYTLTFQENGIDILTPANFSVNENSTKTITIVAESILTTAACIFTARFDLTFISLPVANSVYTANSLCFGSDFYNLADFENQFFAGKNYQFSYSLNGGTSYQSLTEVNPQNTNPVFVKIKHPSITCETVIQLKFNFNPEVEIKPYTQFPAHCFISSEYFDLNITKSELEYLPEIKATFFTNSNLTSQITNLNYTGSGLVYIRVENIATGCLADSIPQLNLQIYPKPALIKGTPEVKNSQCGTTLFNLTTNINDYIGVWTRYSEIRYYDFAGNRLSQTEWENYDLSIRNQPYMIFVYNETNNLQCSDRILFDLVEYKKPIATTSQILICSETNYSLQSFENEVINIPSNYTFTDLSGNPLPANFNLSSLPLTIDFLIKDNSTGCISDPQSVTFVKGGNSVLSTTETDYELCDTDFNGITTFSLDSKKSVFTNDSSAIFEYFKDAGFTQSIPANYTNEIAFAQTIHVRITLPGFCPSSAKIYLKANTPTKSTTLIDKYFICYGETKIIDAGTENDYFEWSDGQTGQTANFTQAGTYSVILRKGADGCPYTHTFTISDENQPKIQLINQTSNSIEVIADGGAKPYTYYFNGISNGFNNVLQNPTASSYNIQVKSASDCFGSPKTVYFVKINNTFTPNADGINDIWKIDNLDKMEQVSIVIVDRIGTKVFASTNAAKAEWDGKAFGRALPTSTYWYVVSWYDTVTKKTEQRQGWILLKNRN